MGQRPCKEHSQHSVYTQHLARRLSFVLHSGQGLRPDQTVDLGTSTQGVLTDEQNLDHELKARLEQLHEVTKTIEENETKVCHEPHRSESKH